MPTGFDLIWQRYKDNCDGITDSGSNGDNPKPAEAEPAHHRLLTTRETADYLNVTPRTVWGLSGKGALKSAKVGGQLRFKREWIDEFIEAQARNGKKRKR